jgi:hypothetical protein
MKISKKHLLEWLTAEQAEKQAKSCFCSIKIYTTGDF